MLGGPWDAEGPQGAPCGPFCGPVGLGVITGEQGANDTSSVSERGAFAVSFDQLSRRHLQSASETADGREAGIGAALLELVDGAAMEARQPT